MEGGRRGELKVRMRKKGKNTNQNGKNIGFEGDYMEEFLRGGEKKKGKRERRKRRKNVTSEGGWRKKRDRESVEARKPK